MTILVQRSLLQLWIALALYSKISHPVCLFQGIKANYQNMNFLRKMGGYFSQPCLNETTDFRFPVLITKVTKKNVTVVIYEFLQQTFQLFSRNLPKGAWSTSNIEKFQNGIHHRIEELETCVLEEIPKARNSFQTWILKSTGLGVKKYFQKIFNLLKDKQYSHCSWEAVQMELIPCLIIFDSLMKTTHQKEKEVQGAEMRKIDRPSWSPVCYKDFNLQNRREYSMTHLSDILMSEYNDKAP